MIRLLLIMTCLISLCSVGSLDEPRVSALPARTDLWINWRARAASCTHPDWGARHFKTEGAGLLQKGSKERVNIFQLLQTAAPIVGKENKIAAGFFHSISVDCSSEQLSSKGP
jgi:hypothetical protein